MISTETINKSEITKTTFNDLKVGDLFYDQDKLSLYRKTRNEDITDQHGEELYELVNYERSLNNMTMDGDTKVFKITLPKRRIPDYQLFNFLKEAEEEYYRKNGDQPNHVIFNYFTYKTLINDIYHTEMNIYDNSKSVFTYCGMTVSIIPSVKKDQDLYANFIHI